MNSTRIEAGSTVRAIVLEALRKTGYAVPADELIDRRRRARLFSRTIPASTQRVSCLKMGTVLST
jgi:hypothetical protein